MADKKVNFVLDLDVKQFTEAGIQAKGVIESLASKDSLTDLVEGLTQASVALGVVGAAAFAFKKAIDLTEEAEHIKLVEHQFESLSAAAGLSSTELKEGMEKAAGGLIDTSDLLERANKAIVAMGGSAEKLPQVMELARKATAVFGGDLKSNFDNITTAVSNGNTRMLKQYGIVIDTNKAIRDYAAANNLAANEVSEAGRRQAILNAALEAGEKNYKGVSGDLDNTVSIMTSLKVILSEVGEMFTLVFEKKFGPAIRGALTTIKDFASNAKTLLTAQFGEGIDQNTAKIKELEQQLTGLKNKAQQLDEGKGNFFERMFGDKGDQYTAQIQNVETQLTALKAKQSEMLAEEKAAAEERKEIAGGGKDAAQEAINNEAHLANELKFRGQLLEIRKKFLEQDVFNIQSLAEIEQNVRMQNELEEEQHQLKIEEIKNSAHLNETQKASLLQHAEEAHLNSQKAREMDLASTRNKLLDQYVKNSTTAFQGIERAFEANAKKSTAAQKDFGKRGEEVLASFQTHSTEAFEGMGAAMVQGVSVAEATTKAMKSLFLNMIADRAEAEGKLYMGMGFLDPAAFIPGVALLALAGAIRAVAGGGGGSSSIASPGGGGGGGVSSGGESPVTQPVTDTGSQAQSAQAQPEMAQMQRQQRLVNINIAGNYMETDSTRRQLLEMIRQESDATGFTYNQIGVG